MTQETNRTAKLFTKPPQWWAGLSFFLLVIMGLAYLAWGISAWLHDEQRLPIQEILIAGEHQFIDDERLRSKIKQEFPGSFFEIEVNEVQRIVEQFEWVEQASVRKDWPNKLKIYVVEQQAATIWNDDLVLSAKGIVFAPANVEQLKTSLPKLYGPGGSEQTALQGYRVMQQLLASLGLSIDELFLSERFAWQVILNNEVKVNLGRSQFVDKMQRFVDLYPLLSKQEKALAYADLRYDTGLAAGWLE